MDSYIESSEIVLCGNKTYGFVSRYNESAPVTPAPLFELKSPKIAMNTKAPLRIGSAVFALPQVSIAQGFEPTLEFTSQYINHMVYKKLFNVDDAEENTGIVLIQKEIGKTDTPIPPTKPTYTLLEGTPLDLAFEISLFENPSRLLNRVAAGTEVAGKSFSLSTDTLTFHADDHTKDLLARYAIAVIDRGFRRSLKATLEMQYCVLYMFIRALDVKTAKYGWMTGVFPKLFAKNVPDIEAPFEAVMTPLKWSFDLMNDLTNPDNYDDIYYEYFTPDTV